MWKKFAILILLLSCLTTYSKLTLVYEQCNAPFIDENGCVAKMCRQCSGGKCYESYKVIVHCPGDPTF
jgi:hypothetical protein